LTRTPDHDSATPIMSRLTAAQVIGLGEYLNEGFDPATLTVSQLLGVLGFHNIKYPSPYTKPKLVQLFNEEIKSKSTKFKKERLKRENSQASDDGITDGLTGEPVGVPRAPPARRSSRRISRAPSTEQETSPVRPDPPKRRRSSAQPSLGGPSRKPAPIQPALIEESEPEEEELPVRKVGRSKKSAQAAGTQARRVSAAEDSGWEDNNIFQSGAESSSPARPSPVRPRPARKSAVPRKSRKSLSAPPQLDLSTSPPKVLPDPRYSPPQSKFEPQLPSNVFRETRTVTNTPKRTNFTPAEHKVNDAPAPKIEASDDDELNLVDGEAGAHNEVIKLSQDPPETLKQEEQEEELEVGEAEETNDDEVPSVTRQPGILVKRHRDSFNPEPKPTPLVLRILLMLMAIATSGVVWNYKVESASIGYCDTGSSTNNALEKLKGKWNAEEACIRENRTLLYLPPLSTNSDAPDATEGDQTPCPLPPIIPLPHPTSCTPCPEHAICSQFDLTCENGYLPRSYPLVFFLPPRPPSSSSLALTSAPPSDVVWKVLSAVADGLPGIGSIAFPTQCAEDPKRKKHIGALGKAIESVLGLERGMRLCSGAEDHSILDRDGGEAKKWGVELEGLRESIRKKTSVGLTIPFTKHLS
jgi:hypothetical protein